MKTPQVEAAALPEQHCCDKEPSPSMWTLRELSCLMSQGQGRQKRRVVYPQSKTLPKKKIKKLNSICFPGLHFSGKGQGTLQHTLQSRNGAARISAVLLLKRSCRFPFHLPFPKGKLQKKGVILLLKHYHFVYLYQLIHRKYSDFTQCLSKFTQGTVRYLIVDFVFI